MLIRRFIMVAALALVAGSASATCPYGIKNCQPANPYAPNSWTNRYSTNPPAIVDRQGEYYGRLSTNPYLPDSTSNPYGRYGSPYSPDSLNNPYGAGNPYQGKDLYLQQR